MDWEMNESRGFKLERTLWTRVVQECGGSVEILVSHRQNLPDCHVLVVPRLGVVAPGQPEALHW